MKRDLSKLGNGVFDLLVIGGGIYGACVAWEGISRGLSVALVEKNDFGGGTSANSLKVIHGGLRYLQYFDLKRFRESTKERTNLMRIAPHLVHPLPVMIPTYGHGKRGKEIHFIALLINDLLSLDCHYTGDSQKRLPWGRLVSKHMVLGHTPDINQSGLTGAAIFHDAQVYNAERLVLAFLRSAYEAGAEIANYTEVIGPLCDDHRLKGVRVRDNLTGNQLEVRAKMTANMSGPWVERVFGVLGLGRVYSSCGWVKGINVVTRPLGQTHAIGVSTTSSYYDKDAVIQKGGRFLFAMPWRDRSIIGTSYLPFSGSPEDLRITESDIELLIGEFNQTNLFTERKIKREDVLFVHAGLLPGSPRDLPRGGPQLSKQYVIRDDSEHGLAGLICVSGVKYTTARHVAERVIDKIFQAMNRRSLPSQSARKPIYGGEISDFSLFLNHAIAEQPFQLKQGEIKNLVYNYGKAFKEVLRYCDSPKVSECDPFRLLKACTRYAVKEEMAHKLTDVVFRRTDLGTAGHPGDSSLVACAKVMGQELGWGQTKVIQELQDTKSKYTVYQ